MAKIPACELAIVGAGPAGLMAAEVCALAGVKVHVFDAMPSAGRKFLLAGLGGLNLTHSEPAARFLSRYDADQAQVAPWLQAFDAQALRDWAHALGISTFVGSSGRVFPQEMKAAPLLRAWLSRLRQAGVVFHMRHRLLGLTAERRMTFVVADGATVAVDAAAVILACGGASWPRLGSDGAWVAALEALGVAVTPLAPANCGFDVVWSDHFLAQQLGEPVKNVRAWVARLDADGAERASGVLQAGELMISRTGIEGGLVYALSRTIRQTQAHGQAALMVDLLPQHDLLGVEQTLARGRGAKSWSSFLGSTLGLKGVRAALLRECAPAVAWSQPLALARAIKGLPIVLGTPRPIEEAISTAGGVSLSALDPALQCRVVPGVFCAGEMLDWEAPTGGYLLTAVMASGRHAARGVLAFRGLLASGH